MSFSSGPRPAARTTALPIHPLPPCRDAAAATGPLHRRLAPGRLARPVLVTGFATIALTGVLLGASEARADEPPSTAISGTATETGTESGASTEPANGSGGSTAAADASADSSAPTAGRTESSSVSETIPETEDAAADPEPAGSAPVAEAPPTDDVAADRTPSTEAASTDRATDDATPEAAPSAETTDASSPSPEPETPAPVASDAEPSQKQADGPAEAVPATPSSDADPAGAADPAPTADPADAESADALAEPTAPAADGPVAGTDAADPMTATEPDTAEAADPAAAAPTAESATAPTTRLAAAAPQQVGFTDVPAGTAYYDEILWAQSRGIVAADADGTFRPTASTTRAEYLAMLFTLKGSASWQAPAASPYSDVATTDRYYREITWAYGTGLDTGYADRTYRPTAAITRDAAMALLRRLYRFEGVPGPTRSPFTDATSDSPHFAAMSWGYANGFVTVSSTGEYRPSGTIARGEMTAILHRVVAERPTRASVLLAGPTGTYWSTHNGGSTVGAPTGHAYRYGDGLRQDFVGGAVIYSPITGGAAFVTGDRLAAYDARGGASTFGMGTTAESIRGATAFQQFEKGGIYTTDGWTFAVTGTLYQRYLATGGMGGYLNAPIGDVRTGSSGISYQSFKGGQLTIPDYWDSPPPTTPAGGATYTYPTLSSGSTGDYVRAVQAKVGITIDGKYGASTVTAVKAFQQAQGIPVTGVVDLRTWARIMSSPTTIFDGTNGRLAPDQLTIVAPNWTLPTEAAQSFLAMQEKFRRDTGLTFTLNDAYRPFDRQVQLFVAYGAPRASVPGTSNHGDASTGAIDISLERDDVTYRWLLANALLFGFGQSTYQSTSEPWHWQHTY